MIPVFLVPRLVDALVPVIFVYTDLREMKAPVTTAGPVRRLGKVRLRVHLPQNTSDLLVYLPALRLCSCWLCAAPQAPLQENFNHLPGLLKLQADSLRSFINSCSFQWQILL